MSQADGFDQLSRDELVARIEALEDRVERLETKQSFTLEDIVALEDRVDQLERGEVDVQAMGHGDENDLPIQRIRADVTAGRGDISASMRRASEIWAQFLDDADPSQGQYTMTSAQVKTILDEAGEPSHPEARKRAMQDLAGASDGYIELKKRSNTLTLVTDKRPLDRLLQSQQQSLEQGDHGVR